jgi:hypothetical protein
VLQYWTTIILTWWVVPFTLLLFWLRYLPRHEWGGTMLQAITAAGSVSGATIFLRLAASTLEGRSREFRVGPLRQSFRDLAGCFGPACVAFLALLMLSFGAIESGPGYARLDPRSWVSGFFADVHFSPAAQIAEEDISFKPPSWSSDKPDFDQVKGAHLANRDLRYAEARNAFLNGAQGPSPHY